MNQDEGLPVSVVGLRAEGYTLDGNSIVISLRTKFSSAERKYSVPLDCFRDLIVDLQRLSASRAGQPTDPLLRQEVRTIAAE
jgi:hypothetical protein